MSFVRSLFHIHLTLLSFGFLLSGLFVPDVPSGLSSLSPFRLFWRPFGALYGLALRKSEKREWDIRVTHKVGPPPIFIIILLFVGSEVTGGGQPGGLFWYFIFVNLTHQVTLMAVPLIRLLTIRSAEKLSITVVQV
jgi:hypothetical protein